MTVHRVYDPTELDLDQFASVLGRLLGLVDEPKSAGGDERSRSGVPVPARQADLLFNRRRVTHVSPEVLIQ
jgi:hypothetical protein